MLVYDSIANTRTQEAVTELIMRRFDRFNAAQNGGHEEPLPTVEAPATNGNGAGNGTHTPDSYSNKRSPDDDSALSEVDNSPPKKKQKKQKKERSIEDDDAAFAARLQAEENMRSRARSTRGGNTKKKAPAPKKRKEKKKSANKVRDEDDSDIASGSGAEKKSPNRTGGFHVRSVVMIAQTHTYLTLETHGAVAGPSGTPGRNTGEFAR